MSDNELITKRLDDSLKKTSLENYLKEAPLNAILLDAPEIAWSEKDDTGQWDILWASVENLINVLGTLIPI